MGRLVSFKGPVRSFLTYSPMVLKDIEVFRIIISILLIGCKDDAGLNIFLPESFSIELKTEA